jgi:hypothetical protein
VFIGKAGGDGQTGTVGTSLPSPVVVVLRDAFGNTVPDVPVTFTPGPAFGSATPALAISGPDGRATSHWTLGSVVGGQALTASYSPTGSVDFGATGQAAGGGGGGGGGGSGFDIVLEYVNPVDPEVEEVFDNAAARWEEVIVGDVPDMTFTVNPQECSNPTAEGPVFDDIQIMITIAPFDGPGGVLGAAGACWVRTSFIPFFGQITIDQADMNALLAAGRLESVVLHEMGHVLGISGNIWGARGLLIDPTTPGDPDPPDTHFVGPQAIAAFNANGGAAYSGAKVPVENEQGGQGTLNSHWRESVLLNELMTGFLSGATQPLSEITAASLADLGYVVDMGAADSFSVPAAMPPLGPPLGPPPEPISEIILPPIGAVDPFGDVIPVPSL